MIGLMARRPAAPRLPPVPKRFGQITELLSARRRSRSNSLIEYRAAGIPVTTTTP